MSTTNGHKLCWPNPVTSFAKGLKVTFMTLFKQPVTLKYPEERPPLPERFRGLLHNDIETCIACTLCASACPVDCFEIEFEKPPAGSPRKRILTKFNIDMIKCMFCGLCTEVCPPESLTMTGGYEGSVDKRDELVFRFVKSNKASVMSAAEEEARQAQAIAAKAAEAANKPAE
jgi:NADH-quinone oxidoreductase subunit I